MWFERCMPCPIRLGEFLVVIKGLRALCIRELDGKEERFSKGVSFPIGLPTDYVICVVDVMKGGQGGNAQ